MGTVPYRDTHPGAGVTHLGGLPGEDVVSIHVLPYVEMLPEGGVTVSARGFGDPPIPRDGVHPRGRSSGERRGGRPQHIVPSPDDNWELGGFLPKSGGPLTLRSIASALARSKQRAAREWRAQPPPVSPIPQPPPPRVHHPGVTSEPFQEEMVILGGQGGQHVLQVLPKLREEKRDHQQGGPCSHAVGAAHHRGAKSPGLKICLLLCPPRKRTIPARTFLQETRDAGTRGVGTAVTSSQSLLCPWQGIVPKLATKHTGCPQANCLAQGHKWGCHLPGSPQGGSCQPPSPCRDQGTSHPSAITRGILGMQPVIRPHVP